MAFFDQLGAKIQSGAASVKDKANNFAEVQNLKGQISSCEQQLKDIYIEIGKAYYAATDNDTVDGEMKEKFTKVKEAEEAIAHLQSKLREVKGTLVCGKCGAEVPAGTVFCSKCGSKIDEPQVDAASANAAEKPCPSCGKPVKAGAAFCASCGAKIEG